MLYEVITLERFRRDVQQGQADEHAAGGQREEAGIPRAPVSPHRHRDEAESGDERGGQAEQKGGLKGFEHECLDGWLYGIRQKDFCKPHRNNFV